MAQRNRHQWHNVKGELKLLNPTKNVQDVFQITKLYTVFDIRGDEAAAVRSFGTSAAATA